jgi:hypothetical protein
MSSKKNIFFVDLRIKSAHFFMINEILPRIKIMRSFSKTNWNQMIRNHSSLMKQRKRGKSTSPEKKFAVEMNFYSKMLNRYDQAKYSLPKICMIVFVLGMIFFLVSLKIRMSILPNEDTDLPSSRSPTCVADRSLEGWVIFNASPFASFRTISGYSRTDCESTDQEHVLFLTKRDGFNPKGFQVELLDKTVDDCPFSAPTIVIQCHSL